MIKSVPPSPSKIMAPISASWKRTVNGGKMHLVWGDGGQAVSSIATASGGSATARAQALLTSFPSDIFWFRRPDP